MGSENNIRSGVSDFSQNYSQGQDEPQACMKQPVKAPNKSVRANLDPKKSAKEFANATVYETAYFSSTIRTLEQQAKGVLEQALQQDSGGRETFEREVCEEAKASFNYLDFRNWKYNESKALRFGLLQGIEPNCNDPVANRNLVVSMLDIRFSKAFGFRSPELENLRTKYLTGQDSLSADWRYLVDGLPIDFRSDASKSAVTVLSTLPAAVGTGLSLLLAGYGLGSGAAKTKQAIEDLNRIEDPKERKEAYRRLSEGSSRMALSVLVGLRAYGRLQEAPQEEPIIDTSIKSPGLSKAGVPLPEVVDRTNKIEFVDLTKTPVPATPAPEPFSPPVLWRVPVGGGQTTTSTGGLSAAAEGAQKELLVNPQVTAVTPQTTPLTAPYSLTDVTSAKPLAFDPQVRLVAATQTSASTSDTSPSLLSSLFTGVLSFFVSQKEKIEAPSAFPIEQWSDPKQKDAPISDPSASPNLKMTMAAAQPIGDPITQFERIGDPGLFEEDQNPYEKLTEPQRQTLQNEGRLIVHSKDNHGTDVVTTFSLDLDDKTKVKIQRETPYLTNLNRVRGNTDRDERYAALHTLIGDLKRIEGISDDEVLFNRVAELFSLDPFNDADWRGVAIDMNGYEVKHAIRDSKTSFEWRRSKYTLAKLFSTLFHENSMECVASLLDHVKRLPIPEGDREFLIAQLTKTANYDKAGLPPHIIMEGIAELLIQFPVALRVLLNHFESNGQASPVEKFYRVTPNVRDYLQSGQNVSPFDLTSRLAHALERVTLGRDYVLNMDLDYKSLEAHSLDPSIAIRSYSSDDYLISVQNRHGGGVRVVLIPTSSNRYSLYQVQDGRLIPIQTQKSDTIKLPELDDWGEEKGTTEYNHVTELIPGKTYQLGPFRFTVPSISALKGRPLPLAQTFKTETDIAEVLRERGVREQAIRRAFSESHFYDQGQRSEHYAVVDWGDDDHDGGKRVTFYKVADADPSLPIVGYFTPQVRSGKMEDAEEGEVVFKAPGAGEISGEQAQKMAEAHWAQEDTARAEKTAPLSMNPETQWGELQKVLAQFSFLDLDYADFFQERGHYYIDIPYRYDSRLLSDRDQPTTRLILPLGRMDLMRAIWFKEDGSHGWPHELNGAGELDKFYGALYGYYAKHSTELKDREDAHIIQKLQKDLEALGYTVRPDSSAGMLVINKPKYSRVRFGFRHGPFSFNENWMTQWSDYPAELREAILQSLPQNFVVHSIITRIVKEIKSDREEKVSLQSRYISFVADWNLLPARIQEAVSKELPEPMKRYWDRMVFSQNPTNMCVGSGSN